MSIIILNFIINIKSITILILNQMKEIYFMINQLILALTIIANSNKNMKNIWIKITNKAYKLIKNN